MVTATISILNLITIPMLIVLIHIPQISVYIRLLHEAHAKLNPKGLLTSVALHPGQTLGKEGFMSVDRVNLMTYDMSFQRGGGHHADYNSFKQAIQQMLGQGQLPPEKLIVGIPAYARHSTKLANVKSYAEIIDEKLKEAGAVDMPGPTAGEDEATSWKQYTLTRN